jgi:hypothetical protein
MADLLNYLGGAFGFGPNSFSVTDNIGLLDITSVFPGGVSLFGSEQNYNQISINPSGSIQFLINGQPGPVFDIFSGGVDTRGGPTQPTGGNSAGTDLIWYDLSSADATITVTWDDVGYSSSHADKANAFQLQLILLENGNFQIQYSYQNISWTTADDSGGVGGLGGEPAREGFTIDSSNAYQLPASGDHPDRCP